MFRNDESIIKARSFSCDTGPLGSGALLPPQALLFEKFLRKNTKLGYLKFS